MSALQPPRINTQDTGAHELSGSEDDEHFSSASEGGTPKPNRLSASISTPATPITRVERVDDRPAYGEVPGTHAYEQRTADAVPDEVEIVPEGMRSGSGTRSRAMSNLSTNSRPQTPGETPVPKTVVERVDDKRAHGEIKGTQARELRLADAEPDEVRPAPAVARDGTIDEGRYDAPAVGPEQQQAWFRSMWEGKKGEEEQPDVQQARDEAHDDDGFAGDFDEFNEGGWDDDFGDFDEAEDAETAPAEERPVQPSQPAAPDILVGLPPLNLSGLSKKDTKSALEPYITTFFPDHQPLPDLKDLPPIDPANTSSFLSDRSLSLWQQLVSPPPMQPPNWTRSRIRRLFLVSLGVPVDLDEILPPSKQKRLVLPNINLPSSPRPSTALDRFKDHQSGANDSSTSLDSKTGHPTKPSSKSRASTHRTARPGPPPPPADFDTHAAALLCSTTDAAMRGMSDGELAAHVEGLGVLIGRAGRVLEYWVQRKDEGVREKEVLEGVIENLVGFVKGRRGK